ncbi:PucR family transcriptional regulator [Streptacidiphilus jiangxiensis]|uniref:DNA-binding transcriptional regulator, PucR family n=1 Tax=Streptacidiphilus jiangxiensis TaxID=235985 RepID=A0A1H7I8B2_STRJI|nr:PucR family transcriptional regulator [Streptacidiphilus jiangxiensis]SEK57997.1 DNA-binding transcriptional regulator, PucR family [Streptacidiphilus jiangxiensis]
MLWEPPSPRVRELIRLGAERAVRAPEGWLEQIDEATLFGSHRRDIADDPVLAAATRRANRSNLLFWAAANVQAPGERVPANVSEPQVLIARDLVRRGLDHSVLDSYRSGQMAALRLWTDICFSLAADRDELRELLDISSRSISAFVEDTIAATAVQIAREREELTRGSNAERLETVTLLLDGAPIAAARAEQRLGYRLGGEHTAAVVWSDAPETALGALDRAAELVAAATGDPRPLTVQAGVATRWVWAHGRPDPERLRPGVAAIAGVRVAVGSTGDGVDGFRRGHLDALTVQRMLARLDSPHQLATHDEVELVALLTADPEAADRFVHRVLGALANADRELVEAVRTFIACQCNASQAADRLYVHRNTLLRRLARADDLLPRPLADAVPEVSAALAVLRWRGGV